MLDELDAVKFYELYRRYTKLSPNIAVLGSHKRFINYIKILMKQCKKNKLPFKMNDSKTKFTVIYNEQIINYIYIREMSNLTGYYFRKYM